MYYSAGFDACLGNLVVLANAHSETPVRSQEDLAVGLRNFAAATNVIPFPEGELHLVTDEARLRTLAPYYHREPDDNDGSLAAPPESAKLFWDGLRLLPQQAQQLLALLVSEVAFYDGSVVASGSASLGGQLGTICVSPEPSWSPSDIAECLIHEMTHILLRCDEYRFGHYADPDEASREQEFSPTAVTSTLRSPAIVFHSLIVAAEVIGLRDDLHRTAPASGTHGVHGPGPLLIERALHCADKVLGHPDRDLHYGSRAVHLMQLATTALQKADLPERKAS